MFILYREFKKYFMLIIINSSVLEIKLHTHFPSNLVVKMPETFP